MKKEIFSPDSSLKTKQTYDFYQLSLKTFSKSNHL